MDKVKQAAGWVWYPWLAALFPVVFLFSQNYGKVFASEFLLACGFAILAVCGLVGLLWLAVRDIHRAALIGLTALIGFYVYGPLVATISAGSPGFLDTLPISFLALLVIVTLILAIVEAFWPSAEAVRRMTPNLNLVAGALLVFNLATLAVTAVQLAGTLQNPETSGVVRAPKVNNDPAHPDVYYIILDAYPSNQALMDVSQIDNSDFTSGLEKRGFYVAYESRSNYPFTLPSMASSLNMQYLEPNEQDPEMTATTYARSQIADGEAAKQFLARGYTYVFVLSGFDSISNIADLNIDLYADGFRTFPYGAPLPADSFQRSYWPLLLETTMLADVPLDMSAVSEQTRSPVDVLAWERVLANLDEGPAIARMPQATFTVLHFIMPHEPVRFTGDGQPITDRAQVKLANGRDLKTTYPAQLKWFNTQVLTMLDQIIAESSIPPIIIVQGDHGSVLGKPHPNAEDKYFRILNAYYLPGQKTAPGLSQTITPVNSLRVVLNTYFGGDFEMLGDRFFRRKVNNSGPLDLREIFDPPD